MLLLRATVSAIFFAAAFAVETYDGHKVYKVTAPPGTEDLFRELESESGYDFWSDVRRHPEPMSIMVSPEQQESFKMFLEEHNIPSEILIENVRDVMEAEKQSQLKAAAANLTAAPRSISFAQYHRLNAINQYLNQLANQYPNVVTERTIGLSYEGRAINALEIKTGVPDTKPIILIEGGIHAREWISPALVLYIIHQLVENSAANRDVLDIADWYIVPVLNVDGYEYSHTNERLWRKTRSYNSRVPSCRGVDGNRNFDFFWRTIGASSDPCSQTFAGELSFSEPEIRAFADYALNLRSRARLHLSIHSYGNYLLYSWGHTTELPPDWVTLDQIAQEANAAQRDAGGPNYRIGSSSTTLYPTSGGSVDWAKVESNFTMAYTVELPGGGSAGFDLPANRIYPVVTQFFQAIRQFALQSVIGF